MQQCWVCLRVNLQFFVPERGAATWKIESWIICPASQDCILTLCGVNPVASSYTHPSWSVSHLGDYWTLLLELLSFFDLVLSTLTFTCSYGEVSIPSSTLCSPLHFLLGSFTLPRPHWAFLWSLSPPFTMPSLSSLTWLIHWLVKPPHAYDLPSVLSPQSSSSFISKIWHNLWLCQPLPLKSLSSALFSPSPVELFWFILSSLLHWLK